MAVLMTTSVNTPDEVVEKYMTLMRDGAEEISNKFYQAGFITYKTARLGISMPLHSAAEKYYERYQQEQKKELQEKTDLPADASANASK